jgi:Flp pilus assembly protein CpaB
MGESLNPTVLDRLSRAVRPDYARTAMARRLAAGFLVLLAAAIALRPDPDLGQHDVVVAVRDLSPGMTLSLSDVAVRRRPATTVPDGALTAVDAAVGATLAGPSRRGDVLTDARILGSRLAGLSAGPNSRVVPLHLSDAAVLDLIRPGDVVDVLGAASADPDAHPRVVASNAVVVLVSAPSAGPGPGDERVVLVALPAGAATSLAGATLVQAVTLTIH